MHFTIFFHYLTTYLSIALNLGSLEVSGVGLLALLTWPMPLGLLGYHVYLIWAGHDDKREQQMGRLER